MKKTIHLIFLEQQNIHAEEDSMVTYASADETSYFTAMLAETDTSLVSVNMAARFDGIVDYALPESMLEAARKMRELAILFLNEHNNLHASFAVVHGSSIIKSGADLVKGNKVLDNLKSQDAQHEYGYSIEHRIPNKQAYFSSKVAQKSQNHWHTYFDAEVRETIDTRNIEQCEQVLSDIYAIAQIIHTSHLEMVKIGNELFGTDFDYAGYEATIEEKAQEIAERLQGQYL